MKGFKKLCSSIISVILCLAMLSQIIIAEEPEVKKLYVKEIKLIYAKNVGDAESQLPEGFKLYRTNLNYDTGRTQVYMCYSTTEDPDEAITDIRVMHEDGGYEVTDFGKTLDNAVDGVYGIAAELTTAVSEFAENYKAGIPGAVYAKEALDYFLYDDMVLLGDFMVSGKGTYQDYGKMLLMCHEDILNAILSLLALGVQGKAGENWIDKLADVDPFQYDSSLDFKFRESATKLRPVLQQFSDLYCYVLGYGEYTYTIDDLTAEHDKTLFTQMAENKELFEVLQNILTSFSVGVDPAEGEWTAEDMFAVGLNETVNMYDIYALLDCLTPGQEVMLRLTGPYNFIIGSQNTNEVLEEARKMIVEQLDVNEKVPIWDGVNLEMFEQEVALTTDAMRSMAAGKQYDIFAKDVDYLSQKYRDIASIVTTSFTLASATILVTKCALALAPKFFTVVSMYSVAGAISSFASAAIVTNILMGLGITFTVLGIVCAIIVWFFLEDIINWLLSEDYERTTIPMYMVDEIVNKQGLSTYAYYTRVDNVKTDKELGLDADDNESGSDVNANKGYRWMALYTTNRASLGNPIEADFVTILGNSATGWLPKTYQPLTMFGYVDAANLNSYADKDSTKYSAIKLYYVQDKSTPVEGETLYISDIVVENGSHEDEAKKKLRDRGFMILNYDMGVGTTHSKKSTFIGYKLTTNPSEAVRDIRLLYNYYDSGVTFGDLNYASCGTIGNFTLMMSRTSTNPAPPVVELRVTTSSEVLDASLGYEPVNEFSGGMAQPLGRNNFRLYFLPETIFVDGPDYIGGIKTDVYFYNTFSEDPGWSWGHYVLSVHDKFANSPNNYRQYKGEKYGELFFDYETSIEYTRLARLDGDSDNTFSLGFKYTTTKNPYRAVYGIAGTTLNGLDRFYDCISYDEVGFVLSATEISYNSSYYAWSYFQYLPYMNTSEFGPNVASLMFNYYNGYRDHHSSVNSPGKADATWSVPAHYQWEAIHSYDTVINMDITQVMLNEDMNALYTAGYQSDRTPLTVDDVIISSTILDESQIPDNFTAVCSMIGESTEPISLAPTNSEVKVYEEARWGGLYYDDVKLVIYGNAYIYFRNEKTINNEVVAQGSLKEGKYISHLFISSREEIRENSLLNNPDLKCKDISASIVESSLLNEGATTTYRVHINTNFSEDDDFKNANYTFLGITRTNDPNQAIRDIRLYVAEKGEYPKKDITREITKNGVTFEVTYSRVGMASITEQGNKSDADCAKERQVYIYVSTTPALGDPITDIKMSDWFSFEDYEPVVTMDGRSFATVYLENEDDIFVDSDYFMHGNHLSFRREGPEKPYVSEIMIAAHDDGSKQAIAMLLDAGYYDILKKELNEDAGGDYIYLGMRRTANESEAIYDIMLTNNTSNPAQNLGNNLYTLTSNIDLNKDAGGKYIFLYERRTTIWKDEKPLYDIILGEKNHKNYEFTNGDVRFTATGAINQDGELQDINQKAGGDYIYLVKVTEYHSISRDSLTLTINIGSILGSGSVWVVCIFLAVAVSVGGYIIYKKKHEKVSKD